MWDSWKRKRRCGVRTPEISPDGRGGFSASRVFVKQVWPLNGVVVISKPLWLALFLGISMSVWRDIEARVGGVLVELWGLDQFCLALMPVSLLYLCAH